MKAFVALSLAASTGLDALLPSGYRVERVSPAKMAGMDFRENPASVVVLDLRVSPARGIGVVTAIRKTYGYGPGILVLTRPCDPVTTVSALDSGADTFVHGPVSPSTLAAAILSLGRLTGALRGGTFRIGQPARTFEELI